MRNHAQALERLAARISRAIDSAIAALERSRRAQTAAVAATAACVAMILLVAMAGANRARERWSATADVIATAQWTEPGAPLTAENTRVVTVPVALLPDDVLTSLPASASYRLGLAPNTPLTESMISGASPADLVPQGWRVVAMAPDVSTPAVAPGDTVDVVSSDQTLVAGAIVTAAATETTGPSIAVPQEAAAIVATAARNGDASLVLAS